MSFEYTGTDNLEVMQDAKKYNSYLASLILNQKVPKSGKLLDIGAGIGLFTELIEEKGYKINCLELDPYQADLLKKKGFTVDISINDIPDEHFDFIYALNVLEHVEKDQEVLFSWANKLKTGGKMLIYVPAFNSLFSQMDKKVGHFRRYKRKELTKKIVDAGLTPVSAAKYVDSLGFFVTLLYKLIGNEDGSINKKSLIFYDRILFPISKLGDILFNKLFGKNVFIIAEKK